MYPILGVHRDLCTRATISGIPSALPPCFSIVSVFFVRFRNSTSAVGLQRQLQHFITIAAVGTDDSMLCFTADDLNGRNRSHRLE